MRYIEICAAGIVLFAGLSATAKAECTPTNPEIGRLAQLHGGTAARVDRGGSSLNVAPGEAVCSGDVFVSADTSGRVEFEVGGEQDLQLGVRTPMPTSRELAEQYRRRLNVARQPLEHLSHGLGDGLPQFDIPGVADFAAVLPNDQPVVRIPIAGASPRRIQLYPPGEARPATDKSVDPDATDVELRLPSDKLGPWRIVLISGDERILGGFELVDRGALKGLIGPYMALGLTSDESVFALACADPERYALLASSHYTPKAVDDPSVRSVLDGLAETRCHAFPAR